MQVRRWSKRIGVGAVLLGLVWVSVLTCQIVEAGQLGPVRNADVAVVLGAAVHGSRPSPVFEERIRYGIALYQAGKVPALLFTGGHGRDANLSEAGVAKQYAIERGVPPQAIFIEDTSTTTRENLFNAHGVMLNKGMNMALVVSDPLHLKRALRMAADIGIDGFPAPTPTSRYRSWRSKTGFLLRELYFYNHYLITGD